MLFSKTSKVRSEIEKQYNKELEDLKNSEIGVFPLAFKKVFRDFFIEADSNEVFLKKISDEPWWGVLMGLHPDAFDKEKGIKDFFSGFYYIIPLLTKLRLPLNIIKLLTIFPLAIADGALRLGGNALEEVGVSIVPQALYGLHFLAKGLYLLARSTLSPRQSFLQSNKISKKLGYLSLFSTVVTQAAVFLPIAPFVGLSVASLISSGAPHTLINFFNTIGSALTYTVSALSIGAITSTVSIGPTSILKTISSFFKEKEVKKPSVSYKQVAGKTLETNKWLTSTDMDGMVTVDLEEQASINESSTYSSVTGSHSYWSILSKLVILVKSGSPKTSEKNTSSHPFKNTSSKTVSVSITENEDEIEVDSERSHSRNSVDSFSNSSW